MCSTCENPADIKSVCSKESDKVTSYLTKNCGDYEDAATKWFKETCEDAGETICMFGLKHTRYPLWRLYH